MLVELKVKNFKSFGEQQTFSLVANNKIRKKRDCLIEIEKNFKCLPSVAIYGANASGKSNLIEALFLSSLIKIEKFKVEPFLLDGEKYLNHPSEFIYTYYINNALVVHEIHISSFGIVYEELSVKLYKKQNTVVFLRKKDEITILEALGNDNYKEGIKQLANDKKSLIEVISANSNLTTFSGDAIAIIEIINKILKINNANTTADYDYIVEFNNNISYKNKINKIISSLDLGVNSVTFIDAKGSQKQNNIAENSKAYVPIFNYKKNNGEDIQFSRHQVSNGTIKLLELLFRIVYCLETGNLLIADELEENLHPLLFQEIIEMFHNPKINKKGAQLIFTTHSTEIFNEKVFRKEQIYFVEKDEKQMSQIFSLNDFKSRNGEDIRTRYMNNRYGAIPSIGFLEDIFND